MSPLSRYMLRLLREVALNYPPGMVRAFDPTFERVQRFIVWLDGKAQPHVWQLVWKEIHADE